MLFIHRFGFNASANGPQTALLEELGIRYKIALTFTHPSNARGLVVFEIAENHPHWLRVKELAEAEDAVDIVRTKYTTKEIEQAQLLVMSGRWFYGYPLPDDDFGFRRMTYASTGCQECGVGAVQAAPFRVRAEPNWGSRQVMNLHWITDEIFVTPQAFETVFAPAGIECWEVLQHKTGRRLKTVLQLKIPQTQIALVSPKFDEVCEKCGARKINWPQRGYFIRFAGAESLPMFKSREYFGSGGSAGHAILVSQDMYRAIKAAGLKGVEFEPVMSLP